MAQNSKKAPKKGRKAYLNDFQPNLAGEYTYNGAHYHYVGEGMSYGSVRRNTVFGAAAMLVGLLAPGFVRAGGMGNCFYVLIPYMAEAISVFVTMFAVFKMLTGGERIREYIFEKSVKRIPAGCVCCAVFAAIGFVCSMVFSAINGIGGSTVEAAVLIVGKCLGVTAPLALRKHILGLSWEKH